MARRHISQAEAHKLASRVAELEELNKARFERWNSEFPGGIHIESLEASPEEAIVLKTVKRLEHIMVAKFDGTNLLVYAINPHKPLQK